MTTNNDLGAVHPVADLFPLLAGDELQQLAEDIRRNGLHQPIVRDAHGVIIDGRNRLLACHIAGVAPRFVDLPAGADPVAYILSANIARRHLSQGQRAMVVAKAQEFSPGKSQRKGQVAKAAGLSGPLLSRAITVLEYAPPLADPVLTGDLSLNDAYSAARWNKLRTSHPEWGSPPQRTITMPATMGGGRAAIDPAQQRVGGNGGTGGS